MRSTKRRYTGNEQSLPAQSGTAPVLQWIEEVETKFRFRYESELGKGSHGSLRASSTDKRKIFPKLQLSNYTGDAYVCVRLLTSDNEEHVHKLVSSKHGSKPEDALFVKMSNTNPKTVELKNASILFIGKEKLDQFCREVVSERGDYEDAKKYRKEVENVVVLCIDALDENMQPIPFCAPLYSNPIRHSKSPATSDLNIEYISRVSGLSKGGDDVFIFCNNIVVRFFERDPNTGNEIWESVAEIVHVHHQVGIYFRTPPYHHMELMEKVDVQFELYRMSDGETSQPRDFMYIPDESVELRRKKRKTAASFNPPSPGQFHATDIRERNKSQGDCPGATALNANNPPPASLDNREDRSTVTAPMKINPLFPLDLGEIGGLRAGSVDPCLASYSVSNEELPDIDYFIMQTDAQVEETHDPILFEPESVMTDSSSQIRPKTMRAEAQMLEVSIPIATVNESVTENAVPRRPMLQPDAGKGLAFRLALSTARALHQFARTGDVRFLLSSMRHLIAVQDESGDNPIHSSVINTQEETFRNLVEVARTVADYDILNMCNDIKQTPLHIAVCTQQTRVTEMLLYHGANPNATDTDGNTSIHMAAQQSSSECLDALLSTNNYAAKYKSHVPDLNAYNYYGLTPLHLAVLAGSESTVRSLCAKGCHVDLLDRTNGRSALHMAVEKNHIPIVRLLLEEAGAETDVHMFNGNTPLHVACDLDHLESISLLVQAHADPYLENLEVAEESISDGETSSSTEAADDSQEEEGVNEEEQTKVKEDVRGLTSLDLAHSDEVRRLLRGELEPVAVQTKATKVPVQELVVTNQVAAATTNKPEKKPDLFDSGIGFSGTNISLAGDAKEDDASKFRLARVTDRLDESSLRELSKRLDHDDKWKKVANFLDLNYLIGTLQDLTSSPSISIMSYAQVDRFEEALVKLHFLEELKMFKEAKAASPTAKMTSRLTEQLEKQVQELNL